MFKTVSNPDFRKQVRQDPNPVAGFMQTPVIILLTFGNMSFLSQGAALAQDTAPGKVAVANNTDVQIRFALRIDETSWNWKTLGPGEVKTYSFTFREPNGRRIPEVAIRFNRKPFSPHPLWHQYSLVPTVPAQLGSQIFYFKMDDDGHIDMLRSGDWNEIFYEDVIGLIEELRRRRESSLASRS